MRIALLTGFVLFCLLSKSQAPSWVWAKSMGTASWESGYGITTDTSGNVYVTGPFINTINFDTITLISNGDQDIFVAKFNPSGNVIWAKSFGGGATEQGMAIACNAKNEVVVCGIYQSNPTLFGSFPLSTYSGSPGYFDSFVVKLDAAGTPIWAKRTGGTLDDHARGICYDNMGNVFVTGYYNSAPFFAGFNIINATVMHNAFLVKYDSLGNEQWARTNTGTGDDFAWDVATDAAGNCYMVGNYFLSDITLGTTTFNTTGSFDLFLVKYDPAGNVVWARSAIGSGGDYIGNVIVDKNNMVIVSGGFYGSTINFGTNSLTNTSVDADCFVVRYDSLGNDMWATSTQGNGYESPANICTDNMGNVFLSGNFESSILNLGGYALTNMGSSDFFLSKIDTTGNFTWATSVGDVNEERIYSLAKYGAGNMYVTGYFYSPTLFFGPALMVNNEGLGDIFVAKLGKVHNGITESVRYDAEMLLSPNPFNAFVIIKAEKPIREIRLYDVHGSLLMSQSMHGVQRTELDLSVLSAGMYIIQADFKNGSSLCRKILRQ